MRLYKQFLGIEGWFLEDIYAEGNKYYIKDFPVYKFCHQLSKFYKTTRLKKLFSSTGISFFGKRTLIVHRFFLPELIYLLKKFGYPEALINNIINHTWLKTAHDVVITNRYEKARITKLISVKLKPYQQEFVEQYDIIKQKQNLNGYILSFEQGLGKTITALCTMEGIGVSNIIIIAPKSTLHSVWVHHIETFYKAKQEMWIVGESNVPKTNPKFIILNYEALTKLIDNLPHLKLHGTTGIIVDESHNFLRTKSIRTQQLINLRQSLNTTDVLLMSGTPVKAIGIEIIPMLSVLDPYFDKEAEERFKDAFGVNTSIATDVIRERLAHMMHRKKKEEVLQLPEKHEETLKIKLPNGKDYTETVVKQKVLTFSNERMEYHKSQMQEYEKEYNEVIEYLKTVKGIGDTDQFKKYQATISWLHSNSYSFKDKEMNKEIQALNDYEKTILMPALPKELRQKFQHCRSSIKYVHLKVMGEVIGRLLTGLRSKMTSELLQHSSIETIIDDAYKKTILFTSYVDTVEVANAYLIKKKYSPVLVYGKTSNNLKALLKEFETKTKANPLIATIQTLATGVTLVTANTAVFLNMPWRDSDYRQASDRIHRIGQDTEVYIYTLILDTGKENNLSTKMEDILSWSKNQFDAMVGDTRIEE